MSDEYTPDTKGLYQKDRVYRANEDGTNGEEVRDLFVLRLADPHAQLAIQAYAASVVPENAELAFDLDKVLCEFCDANGYPLPKDVVPKLASVINRLSELLLEVVEEEQQSQ
jgi:hypothetical protein